MRAARAGAWLCCALAAGACQRADRKSGAPSATIAAAPSAAQRAPSSAPAAPAAPPPVVRGCRTVMLTGHVQRPSGEPLRAGELFDGASWLAFEAGASATFRHAESTREWTLIGPGRMRPCRGGQEQVAVASGTVRTTAGAGARPGAEVLLFTPHGVVRYGDATLTLSVEARKLRVLPASGEAWLESLGEPWAPAPSLPVGKPKVLAARHQQGLEQRCDALAQRASEVGRALGTARPGAGSELSVLAVEHLKARREARSICGAGEAFAATLRDPERGRLLDRFTELEQLALTVPSWSGGERGAGPSQTPSSAASNP